MSVEKIKFNSDELISFFRESDPPENHTDFIPVFCPECQRPLDQSLFTNNWRQKQVYNRPNNRNITLGGSSSTSFQIANDNQQAPIQNTSSTPLNTFSPLSQDPIISQNSHQAESKSQIKDFHPASFHPKNLQNTEFQPAPFQPSNIQTPKMEVASNFNPISYKPINPTINAGNNFNPSTFQNTNPSIANYHPSNYLSPNQQSTNFQPTNMQTGSFQPVIPQASSIPTSEYQPVIPQASSMPTSEFQPVIPQASSVPTTDFHPMNQQATMFQPMNLQTANFQPVNVQAATFQPQYSNSNNFYQENSQPTNFQPTSFHPTYTQSSNFQPGNTQTINFQPATFQPAYSQAANFQPVNTPSTNFQPAPFQPMYSQTPNSQPTNYQSSNQFHYSQDIQQPNILYNQGLQANNYMPQQNLDTAFAQPNFQPQQQEQESYQDEKAEEEENNDNQNDNHTQESQEEKSQDFVYFKHDAKYDTFESVIGEQNYEKAEEEAKQKQIQEELRRKQEDQQRLQESWIKSNEINQNRQPVMDDIIADQKQESLIEAQRPQQQKQEQQQESWVTNSKESQNYKPSMNSIIEDQKVVSSIEAKQQQEQQRIQQQKNKSPVASWTDSNIRPTSPSPSAFEEIIASQQKSKQNNTSTKQMPKIKGNPKGKTVVMSFQDLQREISKPSQWGGEIINPPAPSMSDIIASASESSKQASNTASAVTGKQKKGKKKKEVYDYQEFHRMNEEKEKAQKEAIWANSASGALNTKKKNFSTISTEEIIKSEQNRQSFAPPVAAPVTKRANHRGRGKDAANKANVAQHPRWTNDDDEEEDYYYYSQQTQVKSQSSKPSFESITNSEMAKQNKNQNQPKPAQNTSTATTTNTANSGVKSKKKKQKYQAYQDTTQTQASSWESVSGNNKSTTSATSSASTAAKPQISFDQLEQNQKVEQQTKQTNSKPNNTPASSGPAVQPKKKKKGKKILYVDNYMKLKPENITPINYDDSSESDDEYYYNQYGNKPANQTNFNELLNNEAKNVKKKQKVENVYISSFSANPGTQSIGSKKQNFGAILQQEENRQKSNNAPNRPSQSQGSNARPGQGFANILQNEEALREVDDDNVKIIDDSDMRIPSRSQKGSQNQNQQQPRKNNKKINQDIDNDMFWGAATKDDAIMQQQNEVDDEDYDDNAEEFMGFGRKGGNSARNEKAAYLQKLIEQKSGNQDDDLYDFAVEIINKDRNGLIRSLRSVLSDGEAKSVAESFFNRFNK